MSAIPNTPYLKTVNLGYKYKLYPTDEQKELLNHQMFVYNQAYNICLNLWQKEQKRNKSLDGACNNQSESYNSRFRRMEYGQCHSISNLYLTNYANEIAYREDTRRMSNGAIFRDIFTRCMQTTVSNEFCGYWQGNHRVAERLGA